MGKVIERKFLLSEIPHSLDFQKSGVVVSHFGKLLQFEVGFIHTAYLKEIPQFSWLFTYYTEGLSREEAELFVDYNTFSHHVQCNPSTPLKKHRAETYLKHGGVMVFVDDYINKEKLSIARVYFDTLKQAKAFNPPSWFGKEVTNDLQYRDYALWETIQTKPIAPMTLGVGKGNNQDDIN